MILAKRLLGIYAAAASIGVPAVVSAQATGPTFQAVTNVIADRDLVRDEDIESARKRFAHAVDPQTEGSDAYHLLTHYIPYYLSRAGFDMANSKSREEAYKSIADNLTEEIYNDHVKKAALPAARDKLHYVYEASEKKKPDISRFEEIDKCLREAGFKPEAGEGYEHLGLTVDQFKTLRREQAVMEAKWYVSQALRDDRVDSYPRESDIIWVVRALRAGEFDLGKEETYQEIGTTKARFEELKKKSGYLEPAVKTSRAQQQGLVLAAR